MTRPEDTPEHRAQEAQIAFLIAQNTALRQELARCHAEIATLSNDFNPLAEKDKMSPLARFWQWIRGR